MAPMVSPKHLDASPVAEIRPAGGDGNRFAHLPHAQTNLRCEGATHLRGRLVAGAIQRARNGRLEVEVLELPGHGLEARRVQFAVEDIDHSRTKTKSPQTNGICERFHKTALNEFYRLAFRKKVYRSIDELQADLDGWIKEYNEARPHHGRWCFGKTPMQTFLDALAMTKEKMIAASSALDSKTRSLDRHRLSDRVSANTSCPRPSLDVVSHDHRSTSSLTTRSATRFRQAGPGGRGPAPLPRSSLMT
jgi:hypothetical protein